MIHHHSFMKSRATLRMPRVCVRGIARSFVYVAVCRIRRLPYHMDFCFALNVIIITTIVLLLLLVLLGVLVTINHASQTLPIMIHHHALHEVSCNLVNATIARSRHCTKLRVCCCIQNSVVAVSHGFLFGSYCTYYYYSCVVVSIRILACISHHQPWFTNTPHHDSPSFIA